MGRGSGFGIFGLCVVGCYHPTAEVGDPCSPSGNCPSGQMCVNEKCQVGAPIDAPPLVDDAPDGAPSSMGWSPPTPVPGLEVVAQAPCFSPDLTIVYFEQNGDLYQARRSGTSVGFGAPTLLNMVNSGKTEQSPEVFTYTGVPIMYFASNRSAGYDILASYELGTSWAPPQQDTQLSTTDDEPSLAMSQDGLTAIVSRASNGLTSFYEYQRSDPMGLWTMPPRQHTELAMSDVGGPSLASDGTLYFHAKGPISRDLFVARRDASGNYEAPIAISELNTSGDESDPYISGDQHHIMWEHAGTIYESSR